MKEYHKEENVVRYVSVFVLGIAILYLVLNYGTDWEGYVQKIFGIRRWRTKEKLFLLLVALWPVLLSSLAWWLDRHFSHKRSAGKVGLYVLAVGCGIGGNVVLLYEYNSLMRGIRPDHILYFLVVAAVIGYKTFLVRIEKRNVRVLGIVVIAAALLGIMTVIFFFQPRCREVLTYIVTDLTGQTSKPDWLGYRLAAAKAYWFHDFDTLHSVYAKERYVLAIENKGLMNLAYYLGSWTSIMFILLEIGVCAGLGKMYIYVRARGWLESSKGWIWNAVPYLILSYGIRTFLAILENTFMISSWKLYLPFTDSSTLETVIPLLILQYWLVELKKETGVHQEKEMNY